MTNIALDKQDYHLVLKEEGLDELAVRKIMEDHSDLVLYIDYELDIRDSDRQGKGVFAKQSIKQGKAFLARIRDGKSLFRTLPGRYINHSIEPNCIMIWNEKIGLLLVNVRTLRTNEELTVNYRQVADVNRSISLD